MKSTQSKHAESPGNECNLLQAWLDGRRPDLNQWEQLQLQLDSIAFAASQADQPALHQLGTTLAQLVEVAGCVDGLPSEEQSFNPGEMMDFVESCLHLVLDVDGQEPIDIEIDSKLQDAQALWADQLQLFCDGDAFEIVDPFEQLTSQEVLSEESQDISPETDQNQIGLMLAVLQGGSSTSEEPGSAESAEMFQDDSDSHEKTPLPNKPTPTAACFEPGAGLPQPPAKMMVSDEIRQDQELCQAYLDDAYRCLETMEQVVLEAESSEDQSECIRDFCRQLHTIKGASASVGLGDLANYLHQVEEWLEHQNSQNNRQIDEGLLLSAIDSVRKQVSLLDPESVPEAESTPEAQSNAAAKPVAPALAPAASLGSASTRSSSPEASIRVRASQLNRLMDMLAELVVIRNRRENGVCELSQLNQELSQCTTRLKKFSDQQHDLVRSLSTDEGLSSRNDVSLRLGYEPTSSNAIQEVTNDLNEISRGVARYCEPVTEENLALSHFIRQFRQELMQLRRLPVAGLFQRLQRAARDAGNVENKKVQVQLVGEDTGLEQSLQEQLFEPLMHVVRNAVGHGIEDPAGRLSNKKPETGTITLRAQANANLLVITIADDGRGMDYDALRKRGYERGLLPTDRVPTRQELANLIFHPGFSTRDQASEVAGRGIGMDVVANVINRLRGRIEIESTPGQGTEMRFSIPLQTGIEHTMVFRACGQLYALPMRAVSVAECTANDERKSPDGNRNSLVEIPFADVIARQYEGSVADHYLILEADRHMARGGIQSESRDATDDCPRFGMLVEDIIGPEEVVVRNLPPMLHGHPMIRGVVLAANGEIVMLLDAERLLEFCLLTHRRQGESPAHKPSRDPRPSTAATKVLVVDDSLSARRSLMKRMKPHPFEIIEAGDGIEALDRLRCERFDLIVTDLDMPRMGGLELLSEIQRCESIDAPVVVASSRTQESIKHTAQQYGAAAFMNKPVSEERLNAVLKQLDLI